MYGIDEEGVAMAKVKSDVEMNREKQRRYQAEHNPKRIGNIQQATLDRFNAAKDEYSEEQGEKYNADAFVNALIDHWVGKL